MRSRMFRQSPEVQTPALETAPQVLTTAPAPRVWVSDDDELTQAARAYRCPSHGRSQRAKVRRDAEGVETFEGVCCRAAQDAIRSAARSEQDAEQVVSDEGAE